MTRTHRLLTLTALAGTAAICMLAPATASAAPIMGTAGDDTLTGTARGERIFGRAGNDVINAGGGRDRVFGQRGADTLSGEDGRDLLHGHHGDDSLSGGDGRDRLWAGSGVDALSGGAGDDRLFAMAPDDDVDTISCGDGEDWVRLRSEDAADADCEHVTVLSDESTSSDA